MEGLGHGLADDSLRSTALPTSLYLIYLLGRTLRFIIGKMSLEMQC